MFIVRLEEAFHFRVQSSAWQALSPNGLGYLNRGFRSEEFCGSALEETDSEKAQTQEELTRWRSSRSAARRRPGRSRSPSDRTSCRSTLFRKHTRHTRRITKGHSVTKWNQFIVNNFAPKGQINLPKIQRFHSLSKKKKDRFLFLLKKINPSCIS